MNLIIRNAVTLTGALVDVRIEAGRIAELGKVALRGKQEIDARGTTMLPGLHDHHLHILATAARRQSIDLTGLTDPAAIRALLAAAPDSWLRAVGYDERAAGLPDAGLLDTWERERPLRVLDRTGALWALNSAALAQLRDVPLPDGAERDASGRLTGRFWREDQWLGRALPRSLPDLARLGMEFAALGLTGLTDAGAHNGPDEARILSGAMPQRLTLMGSEALEVGDGYTLGPLKLLIDERDPPALDLLAARIRWARERKRAVAAHCVTDVELALYLAALDLAGGPERGDRIEHGGMIAPEAIPAIVEAGLVVVSNPSFIHDRGDRYLAEVPTDRLGDLYRLCSLIAAGVPVKAGSDAPYANPDPWLGVRSARDRMTQAGHPIAKSEVISAREALQLYFGGQIAPGEPADLVLCSGMPSDVLEDPDTGRVRMTLVHGAVVFDSH
ncbi:MAG: amidohydrolase family protein [Sphingomonadales bacterium]|nr:amidohydrolase family protein [Sphingomonadales bacterium]